MKDGSFIGIVEANNEVAEVYLIENGYEYLEAVRNTGAYESYVSYMETNSKRTALDSAIMIIQLLQNGQDDFIMVQAAGNGYDNSGPGVDAMWSCFFSAVDEDIYNLLSSSKRESLEKQGITYNDIANRIMIVGAVDNIVDKNGNYQMTYFSNYGDNVDICAPGENIYSTVTDASGNYETESGTSMAAPMVTGAAALLWQVNPDLSAPEVKELLENSTSTFAIGVGADAGTHYPMLDIGAAVKSLLGKDKEEKKDNNDVKRDVVLVLDRSGSMGGEPLEQTKEAAVKFIDTVFEKESRVSVVTYDDRAFIDCGLTDNQQELEASIDGIYSGGSTNMYEGLEQADNILQNSQADRKIVVLMSDGLPNEGANDNGDYHAPLLRYAEELKNKGYYVYTLGFFNYLYSYDLYDAQQLLEGIASPGLHYEVNNADDLVFFFDDIANQISGTRFVYIRIACPVDVTVTSGGETLSSKADSENTRTSFGALTYESVQDETEDADGDYYYGDAYAENTSQEQVKILRLNMEQDYDVEIEGYDSGTMDYTISFPNDSGEYDDVRLFPDIEVTASTKATSNTGEASATYLKVDKDGDGKIDATYKTEANGEMEEVKDNKGLYIVLIVAGVVILLVIILIIILACVSGKKKRAGQGDAQVMSPVGSVYGAFGIFSGQSYPLCIGQRCVVGRKSSCDIQLVHGQVSRTHCVIEMLPDGVYQVTDHSSNGTFYNNQKLKYGEPYRLPKGALLAIGDADNVLELR